MILRRKAEFSPPQIESLEEEIDDDSNFNEIDANIKQTATTDEMRTKKEREKEDEIGTNEVDEYDENDEMEEILETDEPGATDDLDTEFENDSINDEEQTNIAETELMKPTTETKHKIRRLIERHYRLKAIDRTELVPGSKPSTKLNIKQIIKKEKIKELIEKISQIDLRTVCDLETETTKHCLLKIIDSYVD